MRIVKLESSDGKIFEVDAEVAKCSDTIKNIFRDCDRDDEEDAVIPLENVNSDILARIIDWAEHHKGDYDETRIVEWDTDFLEVDERKLFELVLAADYMNIKGLLYLTCRAVAKMLEGKSPEWIRRKFKIDFDF